MRHQKNSTLPPGVREEKTMRTLSGHHHHRCQVWSSNCTFDIITNRGKFFNTLIQNPKASINYVYDYVGMVHGLFLHLVGSYLQWQATCRVRQELEGLKHMHNNI